MSVEPTKSIANLAPTIGKELINTPAPKMRPAQANASANSTKVQLSQAQSMLLEPNGQDIDLQRVEEIKQAIRNGHFQIDSGKIADGLIAEAQALIAEDKS